MLIEKANEQISIRVTKELKEQLELEAKIQKRPLANYIKAILTEHLETSNRIKKIAEHK